MVAILDFLIFPKTSECTKIEQKKMIYIRKIYSKKVVYFLLKRGKFTNSEKKSVLKCDCHGKLKFDEKGLATPILVPRAHDPFGLRQGSRPLEGTEAGSPRITDFRLLCAASEI